MRISVHGGFETKIESRYKKRTTIEERLRQGMKTEYGRGVVVRRSLAALGGADPCSDGASKE